ncbi:MAG TPA: 4-(cytidine 5'-diphospho)-2-C-methyl-D-erythritol kinase [Candidatus Limiplasma sp.]|nr:4-(cytidine 5'-diphospho)-2-C-methyl-D-erythritol kinase [Candidatus Limiplasma sp.]
MLKVTARAKINWSLDILGTLPSGYHKMDMLMTNVSLSDELLIAPHTELKLTVQGNPTVDNADNIVYKAAAALRSATGYAGGADITLYKRIPHGAGMGGGSTDAAATLIGLNRLWQTALPLDALHGIAQELGADVPFFLTGGFARIGGFGEIVSPLPPLPDIPLVILQPCKPQSTQAVFALFDVLADVAHPDTDTAQQALLHTDFDLLARSAGNVLQQALEPHAPPITEAIAALDACGAAYATMTGSGSAVFGAFTDAYAAAAAHRTLRKRWNRCWLSQTTAQSITMEEA